MRLGQAGGAAHPRPGPALNALDLPAGWPVDAAAAGVAGRGAGAGADPGVLGTTGDTTAPFPWASVTKPLAALAVLIAVEDRSVSLHTSAGPPGATVEHLLSHASGLAPDGDTVLAAPGARRIYSNSGFEALADAVAAHTGIPFAEYLHEAVIEPLGMTGTRLDGSPASGAVGPLDDLLRLGAELLAPTLLAPETLARAVTTAFPGLAGVLPGFGRQSPCDWGLGFEIKDAKSPHWTGTQNSPETFGHFGRSGTFLWVDPAVGLACAVLTDKPFGPWAAEAWPPFSDAVLAEFSAFSEFSERRATT